MGRSQLLLGAGPGMFTWQFAAYRTLPGQPLDPRCEYLLVFSQYGLAGVAVALGVVSMFGLALIRIVGARAARYSSSTLSNRYAFAVGVFAATAGLVVHALFGGPLHNPANLYTLLAMLAVALTCGVHPTGKVDDDLILPGRFQTVLVRRHSRMVLMTGVALVVVMVGALWVRTYPAEILAEVADRRVGRLAWAPAQALYERAWATDRRNDRVAAAAGDCWLAQGTWQPTRPSHPAAEARRWYERAYALNSRRLDLLPKLGRTHELTGDDRAAAEWYRRAVQADPRNAAFHTQLGLYLLRTREPDAAQENFARAVELDPTDPVAGALLERVASP